MVAVKINCYLM